MGKWCHIINRTDILNIITNCTVCQHAKLHLIMSIMEEYQQEFIDNLKKYRTQKKISQAQLAEYCGVSTGTIGNIECGLAKPSFDLIISIANTLNIHPAYLFSSTANIPDSYLQEHKILEDFYKILTNQLS